MRLIALAALLALAACAAAPGQQAPTAPPPAASYPTGLDDTCNGERYGTLVGQDATALERVLILGEVRINRPGAVTTQDYRPARIGFDVGPDNRIARIACG